MIQCKILTKSCINHILDLQAGIELQRTLNAFQLLFSYLKRKKKVFSCCNILFCQNSVFLK